MCYRLPLVLMNEEVVSTRHLGDNKQSVNANAAASSVVRALQRAYFMRLTTYLKLFLSDTRFSFLNQLHFRVIVGNLSIQMRM